MNSAFEWCKELCRSGRMLSTSTYQIAYSQLEVLESFALFNCTRKYNRFGVFLTISLMIKCWTSDNAFLAFWLVHSISVISSYTLVWPYMENNKISLGQSGGKKKISRAFYRLNNRKISRKCHTGRDKKATNMVWNYLLVLRSFLTILKKS